MRHSRPLARVLVAVLACLTLVMPAGAKGTSYTTGFVSWHAAKAMTASDRAARKNFLIVNMIPLFKSRADARAHFVVQVEARS